MKSTSGSTLGARQCRCAHGSPLFHLRQSCGLTYEGVTLESGGAAFVAMMEPADLRQSDNLAFIGRLDRTGQRAVHLKRQMSATSIVVRDVPSKNLPQMGFAEHNHMVEAFTPNTPIESL